MEMINFASSNHKLTFLVLLNISFVLVILSVITLISTSSESISLHTSVFVSLEASGSSQQVSCKGLHNLDGYEAKCLYVKTHEPCVSQGFVDYLHLFYCMFGNLPYLCYTLMFAWLVILFYLMGDTASRYFCSSLEKLSNLLNLSPAIAGVTLLSLGNGAPDVFASLVSYTGSGTKDVGLNSVMGGASFVSCVVIGVISIVMHSKRIKVEKNDFFRDVCFLIFVLVWLLVILLIGEINIWVAISFASLYIVYVVVVYFSHLSWNTDVEDDSLISNGSEMDVPLLQNMEINKEQVLMEEGGHERQLALEIVTKLSFSNPWNLFLWILQMPLHLPRRLTIPVVCSERWSKPYAVMSVTLAPILLATLCSSHLGKMNSKPVFIIYGICFILGSTFGVLALITTERSNPPNKCLFPWVVGSFLMSVTWSYIIANELVGLLVSLGYACGISPSILGLTVLAWGNSLGDLVTNLTLAVNGGRVGAQIAVSACYAGPIFNVLMGLGLSLVGSAWYAYPSSIAISTDPLILETLVFLVVGLLWSLVTLPRREMRLDKILGGGLLGLYVVSVALRLIQTLGSNEL